MSTPDSHSESSPSLDSLAAKSLKSKKGLTPNESEEAIRLLAEGLKSETSNIDTVLAFAQKFSAEVNRSAIKGVWSSLTDSRKAQLCSTLGGADLSLPHFRNLAFHLAAEMTDLDVDLAKKLIRAIAGKVTKEGRSAPGTKDWSSFCEAFIKKGGLDRLDLSDQIQATIQPFLKLILGVDFEDGTQPGSRSPIGTQRAIVRWAARGELWKKLSAVQQTKIIQSIRSWSPAEIETLRKDIPNPPFEIPSGSEAQKAPAEDIVNAIKAPAETREESTLSLPPIEKDREGESTGEKPVQSSFASSQPVKALPVTPGTQNEPRGVKSSMTFPSLLQEIKRLWDGGDSERAAQQKRLRELETELRQIRSSLHQSQQEASNWRSKFHKEQEASSTLRNDADKTTAELTSIREEVANLRIELTAAKQTHESDAQRLWETIGIEKQRAVEAFANRIAGALRAEHANFNSIRESPMDVDLGEGLRELLLRLFEILKKHDIKP